MNIASLQGDFRGAFGRAPESIYFAPGRVNLIGEHIDYNGGRVMPAAISTGTYIVIARNSTNHVNIFSTLFQEKQSIDMFELPAMAATGQWVDYIVGMLLQLRDSSGLLTGVDVLVANNMPQNSGLSSSASFTVGFGFALTDLLGIELERVALALAAQAVENDFVGVNCGIMDQFSVAMGKADHCIELDCESLDYELVPMHMAGHEIVISNTMVPRKLAESNYNLRRSECEQALEILNQDYAVQHLCELGARQVESCEALRKNDVLWRRAMHVTCENERVLASASALKQGRLADFGAFMNASHDSLRDDYEVSCRELDILVDAARSIPGCLGSRMTGAGFGGCTVSIVESAAIPDFSARLLEDYSRSTAYNAEIYIEKPSDGVKRVI